MRAQWMSKHTPYDLAVGWLSLAASEPGGHAPQWDPAGGLEGGEDSTSALPLWAGSLLTLLTDQGWNKTFSSYVANFSSLGSCSFLWVTVFTLPHHTFCIVDQLWERSEENMHPSQPEAQNCGNSMHGSLWRKPRTPSPGGCAMSNRGAGRGSLREVGSLLTLLPPHSLPIWTDQERTRLILTQVLSLKVQPGQWNTFGCFY